MKDRVIVMDTETTGLEINEGDRVIEIGGVEVIGGRITGEFFHMFINPGSKKVHPDAYAIHKISDADLVGKPPMYEVMPLFLEFVGDSPLVIHNAPFDTKFLNNELLLLQTNKKAKEKGLSFPEKLPNQIVDTLTMARKMFPGGRNSLDSLCVRYGIDNSARVAHGAHIDSELLAQVYIEMLRLNQLSLDEAKPVESQTMNMAVAALVSNSLNRPVRPARAAILPTATELAAHAAFLEKKIKSPVWANFS